MDEPIALTPEENLQRAFDCAAANGYSLAITGINFNVITPLNSVAAASLIANLKYNSTTKYDFDRISRGHLLADIIERQTERNR